MPAAALPTDELHRLAALQALDLLETPREERFDRITRVLARAIGVPIALINLIDADRQWGKACFGLASSEAPRAASICAHTILHDEVLVVEDTLTDPRFVDNALVTGAPHVRAYAGYPVRDPSGFRVGTLCAADTGPRAWTAADVELLRDMATWVDLELASASLGDAAQTVRRSESRLRAVVDGAVEGILTLDDVGRVLLANPAACALLGCSPVDLVGRSLHDVAHHSRPDGTPYPWQECPTRRVIEEGVTRQAHEDTFFRLDGTPLPVEITSAPLVTDGDRSGAVVLFRDVSARRELERMKEQFVAMVSHELRTPLTAIGGYVEALLDGDGGPLSETQRADLEIVERNATRLRALIDDLLFVSAIDAGGLSFRREPVRLDQVVRQVVDDLGPAARARDLTIEASVAERLEIVGDAGRLGQALSNVVDNALKFAPSGTAVRVDARRASGEVVVEVADRGPGIPAAEVAQLGRRFFRASTAGAVEGTGLGLTITHEILARHGGRLDVDSAAGAGATFRILLPAA